MLRHVASFAFLGGTPASRLVVGLAVGVALVCYVLTISWTLAISLTSSTL